MNWDIDFHFITASFRNFPNTSTEYSRNKIVQGENIQIARTNIIYTGLTSFFAGSLGLQVTTIKEDKKKLLFLKVYNLKCSFST